LAAFALPASALTTRSRDQMIVPFASRRRHRMCWRASLRRNLTAKWGQPFVVENQPGGVRRDRHKGVMKAPPDGYTFADGGRPAALMAVSSGASGDGPFDVNTLLSPIAVSPRRRPICWSRARPCRLAHSRFDPAMRKKNRKD